MCSVYKKQWQLDPKEPFKLTFHEDWLEKPLHWRKPRVVFCCGMGDLFAEGVEAKTIFDVFAIMMLSPMHTFVLLTKRLDRAAAIYKQIELDNADAYSNDPMRFWKEPPVIGRAIDRLGESPFWPGGKENWRWIDDQVEDEPDGAPVVTASGYWNWIGGGRCAPPSLFPWPLPNLVIGTSVSTQEDWDARVPALCQIPAWRRVVSVEPMLGPIDTRFNANGKPCGHPGCFNHESHPCEKCGRIGGQQVIHGIICGGESGPGARPMHPEWARDLKDQCKAAGVCFDFKQWGEWIPVEQIGNGWGSVPKNATVEHIGAKPFYRVGKKRAGRLLDGRTHDELPWIQGDSK
jgi:protein gp37